jgi:hypothetical protein
VATTNYKNMKLLEPYVNDKRLSQADFLAIARDIKTKIPLINSFFTHAMTEVHEKLSAVIKTN